MFHHRHVRGGSDPTDQPPAVTGELGELLLGKREERTRNDEIILVNPFGLAIEDIAIAPHVCRHALKHRLGSTLNR